MPETLEKPCRVLMVAAENDALPGAKVGGIGDVVRDIPPALAKLGCQVHVVTPSYGVLAGVRGAVRVARIEVEFGGALRELTLFEVPPRTACTNVTHYVLDGAGLVGSVPGRIYDDDPPGRPFASDATKFALFCAAVATCAAEGLFGTLDVVHLHDWHAALVLLLACYDPRYRALSHLRRVFTIHNLSLQGVRPLAGDRSSLQSWFPQLRYEAAATADPRWPGCTNPMATGIRLADAVHVVSPTYAEEILEPSAPGHNAGEGLERDLQRARNDGRLHGILNGCPYPLADAKAAPRSSWDSLRSLAAQEVVRWAGQGATVASTHFVANERLRDSASRAPEIVLTSVGRLTDQKVRLLVARQPDGRTVLEQVLERLAPHDRYLVLGSGDPGLEQQFTEVSARDPRLVFLCGYSEALSAALYRGGTLFLMPSSFEPCGISQMLAMRAGQPCLVHAVGGLRDTVHDGVDGFAFEGVGEQAKCTELLAALDRALNVKRAQPEKWLSLVEGARAARFEWSDSARAYLGQLYRPRAAQPALSVVSRPRP